MPKGYNMCPNCGQLKPNRYVVCWKCQQKNPNVNTATPVKTNGGGGSESFRKEE